jgi:hypothetical protein
MGYETTQLSFASFAMQVRPKQVCAECRQRCELCAQTCHCTPSPQLADDLREKVKLLGYERYKLVIQVPTTPCRLGVAYTRKGFGLQRRAYLRAFVHE